jgi:hypothetical protein
MKCFSCIAIFMLIAIISIGQKSGKKSEERVFFEGADSVLITSHETNVGFVDEITEKKLRIPLIVSNQPNYGIIKEKKWLGKRAIDSLVRIFEQPNTTGYGLMGQCFDPHHTIFLFRSGKISYMDICFSCYNAEGSDDILHIDTEKQWLALKRFFRKQGLKYELVTE